MAETIGNLVVAYLGIGVLFAIYFVFSGARRLDPVANGATWGFRVMIFPGAMGLWPVLIVKLVRGIAAGARAEQGGV